MWHMNTKTAIATWGACRICEKEKVNYLYASGLWVSESHIHCISCYQV